MTLPTELLGLILFWASRQPKPLPYLSRIVGFPEEPEEYTAPSAQQLAFVCRRWVDVLAMDPEYWKTLEIATSGSTFVPYVVEKFFSASRDNLIQFTISPCETTACSSSPRQERKRIGIVMELMRPHLGRLTRLSIKAVYRSSIVSIGQFLDGAVMTQLTDLKLLSQETDAVPFPHRIILIVTSGRYRPANPSDGVSASRLIGALRTLDDKRNPIDIDVEDVEFNPEDIVLHVDRFYESYNIRLCDIAADFAPMFCAIGGSDYTEIVRCEVALRCKIYSTDLLITEVTSSCSMLRMLQDWEGNTLTLDNCLGFDDRVIGALASGEPQCRGLACAGLQYFELRGCTKFSASALKRMCEMRLGVLPLEHLDIKDGPEIDADIFRWFEEHVQSFSWNGVNGKSSE
ncbi:hypothetical protein CONPUDRAFT_158412 [Coniophora puteana RWD-64-598 SS2]|uniref:F-box domain-containing protein n=1 Tax=Coniophora puteana (strain RWD-64-598) TaxID=741705 RepID=A0A5M3MCL7_CONPW|nr:uncharacterized protein CONPUDRAFT_158412 [Coniophora puteana RWD-64-598 SS2]EIW76385.1 hypothetical protein CONPUDRAFT_158412 [Coniophora puteana RWD-64-598 SS2]